MSKNQQGVKLCIFVFLYFSLLLLAGCLREDSATIATTSNQGAIPIGTPTMFSKLTTRSDSQLMMSTLTPTSVFTILASPTPTQQEIIEESHVSRLHIEVDPRLELLAVIQFLSNYQEQLPVRLLTDFDFPYKQETTDYFMPYANHRAIVLFEQMSSQGFNFDAPPTVMIHLSLPPDLTIQYPLSEELITRVGGLEQLEEFLEASREFALDTNFMSFFEQHEPFYQQLVDNVSVDYADLISLETYYGMQQHSYNIILVPLYLAGGYGPLIKHPNGSYDVYSISGPYNVVDNIPTFGSSESFRHLIWHEFSHSFVNPLTAKHWDEIELYNDAYEPIQDQMHQYGYGTWETSVNEHIVRAIVVRLTQRNFGDERGKQALKNEINWGFIYTEALVEELKQFELYRDEYPTLADFYPQLIGVFKEVTDNQ